MKSTVSLLVAAENLKRDAEDRRMQNMAYFNPLWFPVLVLALLLFVAGFRFASKSTHRRLLLFGMGIAVASAVPALLFAAYYGHLFDRAIWFYEFRALPYSELSAAGLGWTAGVIAGRLQRETAKNQSKAFVRTLQGVILFCLVLLLSVPYAKPLIAPLRAKFPVRWRNGVCIQSTPSTCGPASAATLLARWGRTASERELAEECFSCQLPSRKRDGLSLIRRPRRYADWRQRVGR